MNLMAPELFARDATLWSDRQPVLTMPSSFVQGVGVTELLIVLAIVLVIFGPKRLPALGRQLGSGVRDLKDSMNRRHEASDAEAEREARPARPELPAGDR